ncbi:5023_t:CDS:2, partial [Racocetra fulgida]
EPPSLEKDEAVLKSISGDKERCSPQNDKDFCVAQCAVQLESSLSNRKHKANEIEEDRTFGRVFVTDAEKFYFMAAEPVVVVYKDENLQTK